MNCEIVRDLLPLYEDGLCSEESRKAVEEHLKTCEACREALSAAKADPIPAEAPEDSCAAEADVLRGISKEWRKRKRRALWKGTMLAAALLLGLALMARPALMLFLQTGAMGTETDLAGDLLCGYNSLTGEAFAASYRWDGSEETMDFTVPDTVFGYRVTALGGYVGRGAPYAFCVQLPETLGHPRESFGEELWEDALERYPNAYVVELPFTVHIGRELEAVEGVAFDSFYGFSPDGQEVLWHVTLTVDCDPENKTFYSENGILYDRKTGEAILGTAEP